MSTDYHSLQSPITSVRLDPKPGDHHNELSIWLNHQLAGVLKVDEEEGRQLLVMMYGAIVLHTSFGGDCIGCEVSEQIEPPVSDDTLVVSDYGEIMSALKVRCMAGKGKKG